MKLKITSASDTKTKLGQVIFIVGSQWGDEGKGKLVDALSEHYDFIGRASGGANAGHTVCVGRGGEAERYIFHLLPSGILHENKIAIIGNGAVIHLPTLLDEVRALEEKGLDALGRLRISDRAHLIFDYHKDIDEIQERRKGEQKIGTTKQGIGPAYSDKISRRGIRMVDLLDQHRFAEKFRKNAELAQKEFGIQINIESEINFYKDVIELLEPIILNTTELLNKAYQDGKSILIEGVQGTHLDIDMGTYPYVTSSNTTSGGACTGLGISPNKINSIIGIAKAYTTRVGGGPFPTELANIEGDMLREQGGEYGATTGRPRRCGWFDAVLVKNAITINGINSINLTKLDVLRGFKSIKIATHYTLNGQDYDFVPADLDELESLKASYIEMPGWDEDISQIRDFEKLPTNAKNYILKVEEVLGVPINFIGVGVHRNETIYR